MSSTTPLRRKRLGRTRAATALAAAGALIMSAGVIGLIASPASASHGEPHGPGDLPSQAVGPGNNQGQGNGNATASPGPEPKVVVCKYVTTPGGVGHHVIIVNENTLRNIVGTNGQPYAGSLPFSWTDAHGQTQEGSVAIRLAAPGEQAKDLTFAGTCGGTSPPSCPPGQTDYNGTAPGCGSPPPPGGLEDLAPAVTFNDADCDTLGSEDWDGTLEAFVDYEESGDVGPGETVTVEAEIEPAYAGTYEFAPGAQTEFTHTFSDVTLADCVQGEETVVPKPKPEKPEPKPDKEPTVKGVEVVVPPAAAPTAVAAGLGGTTTGPLQTIAQMLVAGGMLLLMAGAWIGLGRRESGTHEA